MSSAPTPPAPSTALVTQRDMLAALAILAEPEPDPTELMILTDEELVAIAGPDALDLSGGPYLAQQEGDRESAMASAARSLAARHLLRPAGDETEPEGDTVLDDGPPRLFQLDRKLAGVVALRRIPDAVVSASRTLNGGTTTLTLWLFPGGGAFEEYVTVDGFHHFSVPELSVAPDRIARFVDPFDDAHVDGEVDEVNVPGPEFDSGLTGARAVSVVTAVAGDDAEQATFCALPGRMLVLDGAVSSADAAPQPMSRAEVGGEKLRAVIAALIPVVEEPDASEGA